MLAVMEAVTGLFYVTVLVACLVAMYEPKGNRASQPDSKTP
jgi:hypothetical protein